LEPSFAGKTTLDDLSTMEKDMIYKGLAVTVAAAAFALAPAPRPAEAQTVTPYVIADAGDAEVIPVEYYGLGDDDGYGYRAEDRGLLSIPEDAVAGATGIAEDVLGVPYAVYRGPYAPGGMELCARRFRSFDPATGTYTTYAGEQVVCPYLRG
jgi:hypothetical protein